MSSVQPGTTQKNRWPLNHIGSCHRESAEERSVDVMTTSALLLSALHLTFVYQYSKMILASLEQTSTAVFYDMAVTKDSSGNLLEVGYD